MTHNTRKIQMKCLSDWCAVLQTRLRKAGDNRWSANLSSMHPHIDVTHSGRHIATIHGIEGAMCNGTCAGDAEENTQTITLPRELVALSTPVLCAHTITGMLHKRLIDGALRPTQQITSQWLKAADVQAHFNTVTWNDGDMPTPKPLAPPQIFPGFKLAVCISGGFRTVCTGLILLKRFVLNKYPDAKVFGLTWRDSRQCYSAGAEEYVRAMLGDQMVSLKFFDDDAEAQEKERERVAVWRAEPVLTNRKLDFVTEMWFRRHYCNEMRKAYERETGSTFDAVFRTRWDGFINMTPLPTHIGPSKSIGAVDLSLFSTPDVADIETSLGQTYPALHTEISRIHAWWEYGSEMHVEVTLKKAGVDNTVDYGLGRFGRWVKDKPGQCGRFPNRGCPGLCTIAE